jgi:thioredoxin reductase (NADPH)
VCDAGGYLVTGTDLLRGRTCPAQWPLDREPYYLETSMPVLFAAGDVRHGSVKRVASAVGEGSVVVSQLHQYLAGRRQASEART